MPAAVKSDFISVTDYLAAEETSDVRHEYLGGLVYGMAGETRDHNQIAGNLYVAPVVICMAARAKFTVATFA